MGVSWGRPFFMTDAFAPRLRPAGAGGLGGASASWHDDLRRRIEGLIALRDRLAGCGGCCGSGGPGVATAVACRAERLTAGRRRDG